MPKYKVVIEVIQTADELSDNGDVETNPEGKYYYNNVNAETANQAEEKTLDNFHSSIPIGCLDDFAVIATAEKV